MAIKKVWKLLMSENGYDLLHNFRHGTTQQQVNILMHLHASYFIGTLQCLHFMRAITMYSTHNDFVMHA